jgi:hypothetical protein
MGLNWGFTLNILVSLLNMITLIIGITGQDGAWSARFLLGRVMRFGVFIVGYLRLIFGLFKRWA